MPNPKPRPVFLDLRRIRQPATAVLSIGHRVSGVVLVLAIPFLVCLFGRSLESPQGYEQTARLLGSVPARLVLLGLIVLFAHHFLAGIRYLLLDADIGADIRQARRSAWLVYAGGFLAFLIAAVALFT